MLYSCTHMATGVKGLTTLSYIATPAGVNYRKYAMTAGKCSEYSTEQWLYIGA